MNFNDLSLGKRLFASFAVIVALLIVSAGLAYTRVSMLNANIQLANNDRYPKTVLAHTIKDELGETARNMRDILLMTEPAELAAEYKNIAESTGIIADALAKLDKSIVSVRGRQDMAKLLDIRSKFLPARDNFLSLARAGKLDDAKIVLLSTVRPIQLAYFDALDALIDGQGKLMEATSTESATDAENTKILLAILTLVSVFASVVIATLVTRRITGPINEAVAVARRVADGDLSSEIVVRSKDETGQMLQALKDMNSSLVNIVSQVRSGTDTIATASSEIAAGNMDLSSRTEEQASSLEETAASMEELASTVRQNADNARQANQLAQNSSDVAQQGGVVIGQVVETMERINTSAHKIVDIISVIDGIAFQTNILALNAAVEAARAGEQGRGFAVVASEVRNLAQRSAAAAKEIKTLIDTSVQAVSAGTEQVARAGSTMDDVVASVRRVTDIMAEIAAASAEQSAGIEQVNQAVTQMDEVTQQNAALVEEAAAAAESLQDQSAALAEVVSVFKLAQSHQPQPAGLKKAATGASAKSLSLVKSAARSALASAPRLAIKGTALSPKW